MNMKMNMKNVKQKVSMLLTNKKVLYVVFAITFLKLMELLLNNKMNQFVFFILIGFLTFQFSKNMTIVLLVALIATQMLSANKMLREGLETEATKDKKVNVNDGKQSEKADEKKEPKPKSTATKAKPALVKEDGTKEEDEAGDENEDVVEEAYENINDNLDETKVKKYKNNTMELIETQQALKEHMENMTPFIQSTLGILKDFDLEGLSKLTSAFGMNRKAEVPKAADEEKK